MLSSAIVVCSVSSVSDFQRREDDAVAVSMPGQARCYTNSRDTTPITTPDARAESPGPRCHMAQHGRPYGPPDRTGGAIRSPGEPGTTPWTRPGDSPDAVAARQRWSGRCARRVGRCGPGAEDRAHPGGSPGHGSCPTLGRSAARPVTGSGSGFVGRSRELEALRALGSLAASGRAAGAVVVAEPGLGKSRLLAVAVSQIPMPVLRVQGYEPGREIAFAAAGGLLRELSRAPAAGGRLEALLVGEAGASGTFETVRLFEVAFRCLAELAPLAILADDLQWADAETLVLLQYLVTAARAERVPLLLLCASRPSEVLEPFAGGLRDLLTAEDFRRIELVPLAHDDGIELVTLLAPCLDHHAAEELWRRAQGSPFWLAALATGSSGGPDPGQLIGSRAAGLEVDARRLFALLLVAGEPLAVTDLAEILGWPEERTRLAGRNLVNRGLGLMNGTLRVAHDLIRESASGGLPESERRGLHRRLAGWLENSAGEDVRELSRALEHRLAAGLPAIELALRMARSPQRRLLGGEGLSTLATIADGATDSSGALLRRAVAGLASELGQWDMAFERWAELASRLGGDAQRAEAALAAATAAFRLGRPTEAHAFARQARAADGADPVVTIEADCRDVQAFNWLEGRPADAQPLADRAAKAAEALVERAGGVDALGDAACDAYVRALRGRLDLAIRRADAETVATCAEHIEQAARDPADVLAAASDAIFSMLQFEGLARAAEPRAVRALEEARRLALPSLEVEATHWAAWIAQHRGRLDEAAELMRQTTVLAERVGPPRRFTLTQLRAVAHSVEASRGDWRHAVAGIEQAMAAEPNPHFRLIIRMLHVWLLGRFAAPGSVRLEAVLEAFEPDIEAAGCGRCQWESVLHGAEAAARLGSIDLAEAQLRDWDAAQPRPRPGPAARRAYVAALVAASRDPEVSLPLFDHAAGLAEAAGHDLMRLWIELDRAVTLARIDRDRAVIALQRVALDADAMGAASERQLAVRELRALGVRTWRRGRTAQAGGLTGREREIAELVATGASNPEIAQTLFLSRKTVERHVSNMLARLGARNRAELATRLARKDEGVPR